MDDTETGAQLGLGSDYFELPGRHVTINQVVAWNMTHWRREAGLTQDELGERLGWSKAIVSAAERSWDGRRVRQFSVDDVAAIAIALGLPLNALFLPPEDDGQGKRYLWHLQAPGSGCRTMADLMQVVMSDNDYLSDVLEEAYKGRFRAAVTAYLDEEWAEEVSRWFAPMDDEEARAEQSARFRSRQATLLGMAAEMGSLADALEPPGEES